MLLFFLIYVNKILWSVGVTSKSWVWVSMISAPGKEIHEPLSKCNSPVVIEQNGSLFFNDVA